VGTAHASGQPDARAAAAPALADVSVEAAAVMGGEPEGEHGRGSAISTWRRIKPSVCGNKASGKCPRRREKPVAQQFWKRVSGERVVKGL